jgi:tetratricopeptide (TPR) repeat protein
MLRPKKKITKRELKEDTLVTAYVKISKFYDLHKRNISIGTVTVVVIAAVVLGYLKNRGEDNQKAFVQLARIFETYDAGQFQLAINGIPEKNMPGLRSIVDNFGSTKGGEIARFYLADAYFQVGKYEEALKEFQDFSPPDEFLACSRLSGIAGCYEGLGKHLEAAQFFEKANAQDTKGINAAENLNNAARNYGEAGEKEKAIELYKRLKKDYPTTVFAREADRFISELSV